MTARGAEALRAPEASELPALCALLQAAFEGQVGALRYVPAVLGFLMRSARPVDPLVLVDVTELRGFALASPRALRWRGRSLRCWHLGPIAVHPAHQGRGMGARLLSALTQRAAAQGVDLLHLTALDGGAAARLYGRSGFRTLQRSQPWIRSLPRTSGLPSAAARWPATWPPPAPSLEVLSEVGPLPTPPPTMLRPRHVRSHGGEALTLRWPVLQAQGRWAWSTQLIALQRPSTGLLNAVSAQAVVDGSAALWGMPEVAEGLEGFEEGVPATAHMVKGLSAAGEAAAAEARGYRAFGPAG